MRNHRNDGHRDRDPWCRRAQELEPVRMNQRGETDRADHGQHPVFRHQRQRAREAKPQAGARGALLERMQIGQHHKRQGDELQQVRVVLEALEIEDRIKREQHHDEKCAAVVHHAQRDQPANHQTAAEGRHRQRVSGPIGDRKHPEPEAGHPARQRRVLAVAELEFLAPGEGFGDIHVDVLRRLQIDQDKGPEHRMRGGKTDHQPRRGLAVGRRRRQPRRQPAQARSAGARRAREAAGEIDAADMPRA